MKKPPFKVLFFGEELEVEGMYQTFSGWHVYSRKSGGIRKPVRYRFFGTKNNYKFSVPSEHCTIK